MKPQGWLLPVSILYQSAVQTRNRLYDLGVLNSYSVPAPVISVGNIAAGGTGKTPFIIYLADRIRNNLSSQKTKISVVSRGYKGNFKGTHVVSNGMRVISIPEISGDEAFLTAESSPHTVVVVDKNRVRGALHAIEEMKSTAVLLDDGFQHRRLKRDLDIVLLDTQNPLGNRRTLPAGFLREPVSSLARADIVVLSKAIGDHEELTERAQKLSQLIEKPVIVSKVIPKYWRRVGKGEIIAFDQIKNKRIMAFAGIAKPLSFFRTIESSGAEIVRSISLPDHCNYSKRKLDFISKEFIKAKAEMLVTTAKDAVKLPLILKFLPVYYLDIATEVIVGSDVLDSKLKNTLQLKK